MSIWLQWLIGGGVIVLFGAMMFLVFKYLSGKKTVFSALNIIGGLAQSVSNMFPDDKEKLDAHDVIKVLGELAQEVAKWAQDPTNEVWSDCKEEILAFIEKQRETIPQLKNLPKGVLEKVAETLFALSKALPGIFSK